MKPFTSDLHVPRGLLTPHQNHLIRRLSSLKGQFSDQTEFYKRLAVEDTIIYEVYENKVPETPGELQHGTSIVHTGKIGSEFYMTKGHFHQVIATAEVYYCLQGHGYMMMETPEGDWAAEELVPGRVLYVPCRWAHRSINVGPEDLITFFVYPGDAGHDYGTIETKGFRKLMIEKDSKVKIIDNPQWGGN
jgi:glucose-6-phosphate isomerase, archaeal